METKISINKKPFNIGKEYCWLSNSLEEGATVIFIGKVRNHNLGDKVKELTLEYYPGMTEKVLQIIIDNTRKRWFLQRIRVIHRIGKLIPGNEIVFIGINSIHRSEAFNAVEFIIDHIKTRALFWKNEKTEFGNRWIDVCNSDYDAIVRWH
ncbi:molybdopterin synthase catalytic subunit MoaE [Candidatus Pantoea edessiphila]|uniref:Molybdopterin synthase catalytic subunit n=1 Tax=Candidatus Pantoea edessiphila TaxID=2044610 RepID=A0A2P5SYY4_9GAMM|nr:molybdopterin synthase catalytic subunit MoaE [Candidatus Pantoea edessiphila]MBK4775312.1 molybdopterin synthase catalytic subunit MoaE [Pantoea sp. Edef]PPI87551.1 molybdopterin synthase catalytic subunit MoaE [Candidatus Pantoea edessiphila]